MGEKLIPIRLNKPRVEQIQRTVPEFAIAQSWAESYTVFQEGPAGEDGMTPGERLDRIERLIEKQTLENDKQNAGIRDLIVVGRTVLTSLQEFRDVQRKDHEEWTAQMKELREAQAETGEKLNILIDTVDRIIRDRNRNN